MKINHFAHAYISAAGEGKEHLPLLDNINWKSISQKLGTRNENMAGREGIIYLFLFVFPVMKKRIEKMP